MPIYKHQQPRRRASLRYAQNAAPSRNLGKIVVVVGAVPGSKTAGVPVIPDFNTRGTRVCRPAKKDGDSPEQLPTSGRTLLNKKILTLLMVMAR